MIPLFFFQEGKNVMENWTVTFYLNFSGLISHVDKGQDAFALGIASKVGYWEFRKLARLMAHSNRNTNLIANIVICKFLCKSLPSSYK